MTVLEFKQALEGLPDDYQITLFDLDNDIRYQIDAVDNAINGRVEINFLISNGE
jgi:hypothetical protein